MCHKDFNQAAPEKSGPFMISYFLFILLIFLSLFRFAHVLFLVLALVQL